MLATASGPWVAMAVLCERVEPRPDGTVDVFGIVDGVVLTPEEPDPLGLEPAAVLQLQALLSLKAGPLRGAHEISLEGVFPSGRIGPRVAQTVDFTDDRPGASFIVPLELEVHEPGTYGFDVQCGGALLTRIALHVQYA